MYTMNTAIIKGINAKTNKPRNFVVSSKYPFILFSQRRGMLSEHRSWESANKAYQADSKKAPNFVDSAIYEFTGWQVASAPDGK